MVKYSFKKKEKGAPGKVDPQKEKKTRTLTKIPENRAPKNVHINKNKIY